ncbi:MAG: hypothetical protein LBJ95_02990 [Oscillospiraceae bacterium]|jgi:hypothetical protein|nr:hypothetical protein [Oscillospiraceae bacterium]
MKWENKDEILINIVVLVGSGNIFLFSKMDWIFTTLHALLTITSILNLIKLNIVPLSDEDKGVKWINKAIFVGRCLGFVGLALYIVLRLCGVLAK